MDFRTSYPAPDESSLRVLEDALGVPLPADYRAWLQDNGGGVTEDDLKYGTDDLSVEERTHPVVTIFFGLGVADRELDLGGARGVCDRRLPPEVTPIATNDAGDLVCLALAGEHAGSVWSWAHEEESADGPSWAGLTRVTDGFTPFVDGLRAVPW